MIRLRRINLRFLLVAVIILAAIGCVTITARSPQHDTVVEAEIDEASGLASSILTPGLIYTHNDSGGKAMLYVLNERGLMPAKIQLKGVKNRDWEDIAVAKDPKTGTSCVFVGDIGDNAALYRSDFIYRFAEPAIDDTLITVSQIDKLEFVFEDGPRDAEALFIDPKTGDIFVISKRDTNAGVYQISYPQSFTSLNTAYKVCSLPYKWVTAADISPNGNSILVKTYTNIYRYKRNPNMSVCTALSRKPKMMPYKLEEQGEAIAWDSKGRGYFTLSEKIGETPIELYYYK